tara:strand:- start:1554 stop:2216 length:663 start_codon:yes stop_codon:yes gene_type:complete
MATVRNCIVHELFSQPLYEADIKQITYLLDNIEKEGFIKGNPNDKDDLLDYSKSDNILMNEDLYLLRKEIESHINHYLFNILCLDENKIKIKHLSSWLVINKPGAKHGKHVHNNSFVSGVFYPKKCDIFKSGDFVATIPQSISTWCSSSIRPEPTKYNLKNSSKWKIPPVRNKVLLFPSHMEHHVEKNRSNEDRYSISFNYNIEGEIINLHGNRMKIKYE